MDFAELFVTLTLISFFNCMLGQLSYEGIPPPVICNKFCQVRNSTTFQDRSLLIKWFFGPSCYHAQGVLAPREFGKTVNLHMLHSFLHPAQVGHSLELKTANEKLFEKLKIMEDTKFIHEHFQQHPVLYFDFGNVGVLSMVQFRSGFSNEVRRICAEIGNLTSSKDNLNNATLEDVCSRADEGDTKSDDGKILPELFFQIYGKKCIVLVDRVTDPIERAWHDPDMSEEKFKTIAYRLGQFLANLLQNNEHVDRGFLTGITRIGGTFGSIFTVLRYVSVFDESTLSKFYGLSEVEVKQLAFQHKLSGSAENVKKWYGGYRANWYHGDYKERYPFYPTLNRADPPMDSSRSRAKEFPLMKFIRFVDFAGYLDRSLSDGVKINLTDYIELPNIWEMRKYLSDTKRSIMKEGKLVDMVFQCLQEMGLYAKREDRWDKKSKTRVLLKVPNLIMEQDLKETLNSSGFAIPKDTWTYIATVGAITKHDGRVFQDFLEKAHFVLNYAYPKSEKDMLAALYEPLGRFPSGPGSWKVASFSKLKVPGLKVDPHNEKANILDILVIAADDATGDQTGIVINLRYGEEGARSAVQQILEFGYSTVFDSDIDGKKYDVRHKAFLGVSFANNATSVAYVFDSLELSDCREFKAAFLEKDDDDDDE